VTVHRLVRQAAELGDPAAGRVLGQLYADGKALPRDPVRGYAWLDLVAAQGDARAAAARDGVAKDLSADQIKAAKALEQQLARAKRPVGGE
jgi:TPR repeat protein